MTTSPVAAYLATLAEPRRSRVEALYDAVRALVPDATEAVRYRMPTLVVDGRGIWSVMSTRHHVGIYPHSGSTVGAHAEALAALGISTTKGAIQLRDGVDLPQGLLEAIVRTRLHEIGRG